MTTDYKSLMSSMTYQQQRAFVDRKWPDAGDRPSSPPALVLGIMHTTRAVEGQQFDTDADILGLIGKDLDRTSWDLWTLEQRAEARSYAGACHLRASDNDIDVPPLPAHVKALPELEPLANMPDNEGHAVGNLPDMGPPQPIEFNPDRIDTAVSAEWVLGQLGGMQFPGIGEAYDYMKRSLMSAQVEFAEPIKCATFDHSGITPDVRKAMDEDRAKAELEAERMDSIRTMLTALGEDPSREGLKDTPARVLKAWNELCAGYRVKSSEFLTAFASEGYDAMVACGPVEFYSTCEHHLLSFFGQAWVAYIPNGKIIGLSKLPRLVEMFARRLQNQERMTKQIADELQAVLGTEDVAVVVKAAHMCMMARGVRQSEARMTTAILRGRFKSNPSTRAEFYQLSHT